MVVTGEVLGWRESEIGGKTAAAAPTLGCSGGAGVNLCRAPVGFDLARRGEA